jgi:hypothetical protein
MAITEDVGKKNEALQIDKKKRNLSRQSTNTKA